MKLHEIMISMKRCPLFNMAAQWAGGGKHIYLSEP